MSNAISVPQALVPSSYDLTSLVQFKDLRLRAY